MKRAEWDDLNDPYDSPGYYEDSAPYSRWRFQSDPQWFKRRRVESVAQNFSQTFICGEELRPVAHLAEPQSEQEVGYRTLPIPANHPIWKGKMFSASADQKEPIDCYMTQIDGRIWYFEELDFFGNKKEAPKLEKISGARARLLSLGQTLHGVR